MRISLVTVAALVVVLVAAAAPARADWQTSRAMAVANAVWHTPCPWGIEWAQPPDNGVMGEPMAWASMQDGCRIEGHGTVYLSTTEPIHTFDVLCTRVVHEVGHLAGAVHSSNPRSVMYGFDETVEGRARIAGRWIWTGDGDPRCRDRGRPYLEAQGVLPTSAQPDPEASNQPESVSRP